MEVQRAKAEAWDQAAGLQEQALELQGELQAKQAKQAMGRTRGRVSQYATRQGELKELIAARLTGEGPFTYRSGGLGNEYVIGTGKMPLYLNSSQTCPRFHRPVPVWGCGEHGSED